jgi:NAD(P)-dependent dehydrogenase (short-subunit alcohol dehydrogenase family)
MELGIAGRRAAVLGEGEIAAAVAELLRAEGAEVDPAGPDRLPSLDILVIATDPGPDPGDDWGAAYELDVLAPLRAMRSAAPAMAERGWGRIISLCPVVACRPEGDKKQPAARSVSTPAALALSRLFADRYAGSGLLVNAVCPDPGDTSAQVAAAIVFLCSERASYVSGAAWPLGGAGAG